MCMPELPEVETVKRGLSSSLLGKRLVEVVVRTSKLRYEVPSTIHDLVQKKLVNIRRRAKYLLLDFEGSMVMLSHLGMSGRYTIFSLDEVQSVFPHTTNGGQSSAFGTTTGYEGKHDHLEFKFEDGSVAVYTDPRRFGFIDVFTLDEEGEHPRLVQLGPEPLDDWDAKDFARKIHKSQRSIKLLLLEQSMVVGVGNIYACEALHRSGISPRTLGTTLVTQSGMPTKKLQTLVNEVQDVLREAIDSGGSTLNDFSNTDGSLGYFSHQFQVYGREDEPCLKQGCFGVIERIVQGQRSTFLCPRCQK
jgi:formamidopyrimidine-DNA glycosylase